ncbi:MAG: hypothetical protein IJR71_01570 [Prevotella sp.]|nr:hypothetical protein [Prevotella sp.]
MNKFDIIFKCQFGEYKLNEAKQLPDKAGLEETMSNLAGLGLGKTLEISLIPLE